MRIDEFLLARIAEDEAVALGVQADTDRPWEAWRAIDGYGHYYAVAATRDRALAECEAKRAIVTEHTLVPETYGWYRGRTHDHGCDICHGDDGLTYGAGPCVNLRAIAAAYAGHPDYDPAWRP